MSGPAPAVAAVRAAVRAGLADLPPGSRVLVACSGGPDSLALAAATAFVAARSGLLAGAVVVDHGWRDDSAEVAARGGAACRHLGLDPVEVVVVDSAGPGGPEAAARRARYAALDTAAARHSAAAVLLGHTLDDQAETVLLGLARGSGARSLAGMPTRRGVYRRPLLGLRRSETAGACAALSLTPWSDPANADPRHQRVRVRAAAAVLDEALGPGLAEALARTGALLAEDAEALDVAAACLLADAVTDGAPGTAAGVSAGVSAGDGATDGAGVLLRVPVLAAAPAAARRRVLLLAARTAGSPAGALSRRHALAVDALITAWHGQGRVHLPGGVVAHRREQTLVVRFPDAVH